METTRAKLHSLVDIVDDDNLNVMLSDMLRYIPEDNATADEIDAIALGIDEISRGEYVRHEDIDWD